MQTIFNFDPTAITFGPKVAGHTHTDRSYVSVRSGGEKAHVLLAAGTNDKLRAPFGASTYSKDVVDDGANPTLALEANEQVSEFVRTLDKTILDEACKQRMQWFDSSVSKKDIVAMYAPLLNPKTGLVRTKVRASTHLAGEKGKDGVRPPLTVDDLVQDCMVVPMIAISDVWFMRESFGVTLQVKQAVVYPPSEPSFDMFDGYD